MSKVTSKRVTTEITLVLSQEEAEAISAVFRRIGGPVETSRRGLVDQVKLVLMAEGIAADCSDLKVYGSSLYFQEV